MTLTDIENAVIKIASEETDFSVEELSLDTRLDKIFYDSLEFLDFTLRLGDLGYLSEEDIARAETLGDLANAIIHPN